MRRICRISPLPPAQNGDLKSKGTKGTLQFSPQLNSSSRFVSLLALFLDVEIEPGWVCGIVESNTGRSNPRPASGSNQAGPSVSHRHLDSTFSLFEFLFEGKVQNLFFWIHWQHKLNVKNASFLVSRFGSWIRQMLRHCCWWSVQRSP